MNIFINLGNPRALGDGTLTKSDNSGNMLLNFSVLLIITAKKSLPRRDAHQYHLKLPIILGSRFFQSDRIFPGVLERNSITSTLVLFFKPL